MERVIYVIWCLLTVVRITQLNMWQSYFYCVIQITQVLKDRSSRKIRIFLEIPPIIHFYKIHTIYVVNIMLNSKPQNFRILKSWQLILKIFLVSSSPMKVWKNIKEVIGHAKDLLAINPIHHFYQSKSALLIFNLTFLWKCTELCGLFREGDNKPQADVCHIS